MEILLDKFEICLTIIFFIIFVCFPIRKGGISAAYNNPTNLTVMAITAITLYIIYFIYGIFFKKKQ